MIDLEKCFYNYSPILLTNKVEEKYLLKNLSNVEFLQKYGDRETISQEEFETTSYYKGLMWSFNKNKHIYGIYDAKQAYLQANYFLALFHAFKNGTYEENCRKEKFVNRHSCSAKFLFKKMINLKDYYMIIEGHHRLSCLYVLNKKLIENKDYILIGGK